MLFRVGAPFIDSFAFLQTAKKIPSNHCNISIILQRIFANIVDPEILLDKKKWKNSHRVQLLLNSFSSLIPLWRSIKSHK